MSRQLVLRIAAAAIAFFLLLGIGRAATSCFDEQLKQILASYKAEQERLGLAGKANAEKLFEKYPTPEITLARTVRATPGGAAEVTVKGKFQPGTKFLFDGCNVQLLSESLEGDTYRAKVQVSKLAAPSVVTLHALAPVSGGEAQLGAALWIGGKYGWEMTAGNGWRIKMTTLHEGGDQETISKFLEEELSGEKQRYEVLPSVYRAEFYRGNDAQPFISRRVAFKLLNKTEYAGDFVPTEADLEKEQDLEKLNRFTESPALSEEELKKTIEHRMKLSAAMQEGKQPPPAQKPADFECNNISLVVAQAGASQGEMYCGPKTGYVKVKGTMKFLGP